MKSKSKDPFSKLMQMAYSRITLPDNPKLEDYARVAKGYLCNKTNTLWEDPKWDRYNDEDLLVEWFSYMMKENEEVKIRFEADHDLEVAGVEDFASWADAQIEASKEELEAKKGDLEDNITFKPEDV